MQAQHLRLCPVIGTYGIIIRTRMSQFVTLLVFNMVPNISGCLPIHIHMYGLTKVVKVSLSFNHFSPPTLYLWVFHLTIPSTR